jgi:Flp pilus assembly pilin Flp
MLFTSRVSQVLQEEKGASSIEYALLTCLIAVFCVVMVTAVGTNALNLYMVVCNGVATATGNPPC